MLINPTTLVGSVGPLAEFRTATLAQPAIAPTKSPMVDSTVRALMAWFVGVESDDRPVWTVMPTGVASPRRRFGTHPEGRNRVVMPPSRRRRS